ncbi:MAG: ATP-NAD kinase family protein [Anaerolineae bacterium]
MIGNWSDENIPRHPLSRRTVGLIVNPIAGMGGSVGLKGTDGGMHTQALALGATPVAPQRAREALVQIRHRADIAWLVAPGAMGADIVADLDVVYLIVGAIGEETTGEDTRRIARLMLDAGAELLIFAGGDGTARDVYDALSSLPSYRRIPVVAIPAGVKVYSAVFALSPHAAAELVDAFVEGADVVEEEVLDIDEVAFRENRLDAQLYGYLLTPAVERFLQPGKMPSSASPSVEENKRDIAASFVEGMSPGTLYLLGPGTTIKAIADELALPKTLLGVDAVCNGALIAADVNERAILDLLKRYPRRKIVVTPLGGNGFIFGRGNKQFTPEVIRQVGREHILVVGAEDKMRQLPGLRVDTGDAALDEALGGYFEVAVGYKRGRVMKVLVA